MGPPLAPPRPRAFLPAMQPPRRETRDISSLHHHRCRISRKSVVGKIHLPSNNIFRYSFYSTLKSSHKGTFISILPNPTGQLIAINFLIVEPCSRSATTDQRYDKKVRNVTKRFDRFQVKQSDGTKRRSRRLVSWSAKRRRYLRRRKRRRIRFDLLHEQRPRPRLYDCPNPAVGFTVVKPRP